MGWGGGSMFEKKMSSQLLVSSKHSRASSRECWKRGDMSWQKGERGEMEEEKEVREKRRGSMGKWNYHKVSKQQLSNFVHLCLKVITYAEDTPHYYTSWSLFLV